MFFGDSVHYLLAVDVSEVSCDLMFFGDSVHYAALLSPHCTL